MSFQVGQTVYLDDGTFGTVVAEGEFNDRLGYKFAVHFKKGGPSPVDHIEFYRDDGQGTWRAISATLLKKWYVVYRMPNSSLYIHPVGFDSEERALKAFDESYSSKLVHCFQA